MNRLVMITVGRRLLRVGRCAGKLMVRIFRCGGGAAVVRNGTAVLGIRIVRRCRTFGILHEFCCPHRGGQCLGQF
ncbi:hypothetical protein [Syntrophobotulus glycolicus]|uniref:hypothetical protein n=1 Tax=Syntrophobotulus glycolicus TaxID=51197 RepID=UPI00145C46B7|nr:hypothetical protein [Syntrophobotulus glycolicus]